MLNIIYLLLIGAAAGSLSGLVGIGGGIILVPALVYFMGYSQHLAQGTTLALLLPPIGIFAAWNYYQKGFVDIRIAAFICIGFLVGSWFGSKGALALSPETLKRIFGVLLLVVGVKMLAGK